VNDLVERALASLEAPPLERGGVAALTELAGLLRLDEAPG
jgi:hypothetical protein